ncbi:endo alpha-1,4 polygalactosaminidase [Amycolatopsis cihanbeyliensis]|uniref:Cysteinyl-tRNA synthetase n=1 Tax=Amycolatopsis cihanbeyliensis TaxID=1128664 RepID=A0A542DRS6_AMYCI|nr:endo alpha-1,4 polygalactosaminidase [Amycolatopsis cihanbeyliensis]TQJ05811.1 cysteinyl-tRNA synthetase [Amycolatopsis cihanbeyliensis]
MTRRRRRWNRSYALLCLLLTTCLAGCVADAPAGEPPPEPRLVDEFVYQLQRYHDDGLARLADAPHRLAVIDLARDAGDAYFTAKEINVLRASGKHVLAYFELGSLENFRPDFRSFSTEHPGLMLNEWETWPGEYFVRYWSPHWWDQAIEPRLDQALRAGFDGVYLDTPLAYEEIDLDLVPGERRESLGRKMVELIERTSAYAKATEPDFLIVPQNSPELRKHPGYLEAIDGIGMEELFFLATDRPCTHDFCRTNLAEARAVLAAGKFVLAVDYALRQENVRHACRRYREEGFAGYVTTLELDQVSPPCPAPSQEE